MRLDGYEDAATDLVATKRLLYKETAYPTPVGVSNASKTGGGKHQGFINIMEREPKPTLLFNSGYSFQPWYAKPYKIASTARGIPLTQDPLSGEYMHRPWTVELTDNLMHIITMDPENQLQPGDYEIYSLFVGYTDYYLEPSVLTQWREVEKPIAEYTPLYLKYQTADGVWHDYGTIRLVSKQSTYPAYSIEVPGQPLRTYAQNRVHPITLPEGAVGVKVVSDPDNISSQINITMELQVELQPSERVLNAIKGQQQWVYNTLHMDMYYDNGELFFHSEKNASFELTGFVLDSRMEKRIYDPTYTAGTYTFPVLLKAYERVLFSGVPINDLKRLALPDHREFIFHDLLPLGADVDVSSVRVTQLDFRDSSDTYLSAPDLKYTVTRIPNWMDSGRVLLRAQATLPDHLAENYYIPSGTNSHLYTGANLVYNMVYSDDSILDWGPRINNQAAYQLLNNNEVIAGGSPDISPWPDRPAVHPYMSDLDGGGTDVAQSNFLYAEAQYYIRSYLDTAVGYMKHVKSPEDDEFKYETVVPGGGSYTYRLLLRNYEGANTKNLIFYDTLEFAQPDLEYWQGQLVSIDVSQPALRGINPRIYYSTQVMRPRVTPEHQDLSNAANWTEWTEAAPSPDLSLVKTIAIDMTKDRAGNDFVLGSLESLSVFVHMRAPANPVPYLDPTVYAHNNSIYAGAIVPPDQSTPITSVEQGNTVKVSLRHTVDLDKTSAPQSGSETAPTVVYVEDSLVYRLNLKNTNTAEAIKDVTLLDTIPAGLEIRFAEIEMMVDGAEDSRKLVTEYQDRVLVSLSGKSLTFDIPLVSPNEVFTFFIPVTVLSDLTPDVEPVFENKAIVTRVFDQEYLLESEPTWHKSTKATVRIPVDKVLLGERTLPLQEGEFTFVLKQLGEGAMPSVTATNQADGSVVFPPLLFERPGNWTYEVFEAAGNESAFAYDHSKYLVKVTVLLDAISGELVPQTIITKDGMEKNAASFENEYLITPASLPLTAEKSLLGRSLKEGIFTFNLKDANENILQSVRNDAAGLVSFEPLVFTAPGTFTYTLSEVQPSPPEPDMVYDNTVYTIMVTAEDVGDGTMAVSAVFTQNDSVVESLAFTNRYEPPEEPAYAAVRVPVHARKELVGGTLQEDQFEFVLKDAPGNELARVTNGKDGAVVFPARSFSRPGVYVYAIAEVKGSQPGITYDETFYRVRVSVSASSGKLNAQVSYLKNGETPMEQAVFTNHRASPKTGDRALMLPVILLVLAAFFGLLTLVYRRIKTK